MFKSVFLLSAHHQALVINAIYCIIILLIIILFLNGSTREKKKKVIFKIQQLLYAYFEKLGIFSVSIHRVKMLTSECLSLGVLL